MAGSSQAPEAGIRGLYEAESRCTHSAIALGIIWLDHTVKCTMRHKHEHRAAGEERSLRSKSSFVSQGLPLIIEPELPDAKVKFESETK